MLICILINRNWRNEQRERKGESVACLLQSFFWLKTPFFICFACLYALDMIIWLSANDFGYYVNTWYVCCDMVLDVWYKRIYVWLHDRTCETWYLGLIAQYCYTWYVYYAYVEMHDIIWWHDAIWLIYKRYMNKRYEHE